MIKDHKSDLLPEFTVGLHKYEEDTADKIHN